MTRLDILKNSLVKKEKLFAEKLDNHFKTVKQANGQPLNDKRNGAATLKKWESQDNQLRKINSEIEKTKNAIDDLERKIKGIELTKNELPPAMQKMIENGELVQWGKHPNICFIPSLEKVRIGWEKSRGKKTGYLYHKFWRTLENPEDRKKFAEIFNRLNKEIQND